MIKNISFVSELFIAGLYFVLATLYLTQGLIFIDLNSIAILNIDSNSTQNGKLSHGGVNIGTITILLSAYIVGTLANILSEWVTSWFGHVTDKKWVKEHTSENFELETAKYTILHTAQNGFADTMTHHEKILRLMRTIGLETIILLIIALYQASWIECVVLLCIAGISAYGYYKRRHWIAASIYGAWQNHIVEHKPTKINNMPEIKNGTVLMLTGGKAARELNVELVRRQHQVIRVLSAFDSGGSSKILRDRFAMPPIGDIRNALMQMSTTSNHSSDAIKLFNYRLDKNKDNKDLQNEFLTFIATKDPNTLKRNCLKDIGLNKLEEHSLIKNLEPEIKRIAKTYLTRFYEKTINPDNDQWNFDFKHGSIGNFILAGLYFSVDKDINTAVYTFRNMWGIANHKVFLNSTDGNFNIKAIYTDGSHSLYQHDITGEDNKEQKEQKEQKKISRIEIYSKTADEKPNINYSLKSELEQHNNHNKHNFKAVIYGPGSFFTSTLQHILVDGMLEAIKNVEAKKILMVGFKRDKETYDYTQAELIEKFCKSIEEQTGSSLISPYLTHVFVHSEPLNGGDYEYIKMGDLEILKKYNITIVQKNFEDPWDKGNFDQTLICDTINDIVNKSRVKDEKPQTGAWRNYYERYPYRKSSKTDKKN